MSGKFYKKFKSIWGWFMYRGIFVLILLLFIYFGEGWATQNEGVLTLISDPYGYNEAYQDGESNDIYLHAREYNARMSAFISQDSEGFLNRYRAFDDNPIVNIDPSGHSAIKVLKHHVLSISSGGASFVAGVIMGHFTPFLVPSITAGILEGAASGAAISIIAAGIKSLGKKESFKHAWSWRNFAINVGISTVMGAALGYGSKQAFLSADKAIFRDEEQDSLRRKIYQVAENILNDVDRDASSNSARFMQGQIRVGFTDQNDFETVKNQLEEMKQEGLIYQRKSTHKNMEWAFDLSEDRYLKNAQGKTFRTILIGIAPNSLDGEEGVGALLLKPESYGMRDLDSAVFHGGSFLKSQWSKRIGNVDGTGNYSEKRAFPGPYHYGSYPWGLI